MIFCVVMSEYNTENYMDYEESSIEVTVRTVFPETWIWQLAAVGLVTMLLSVNICL